MESQEPLALELPRSLPRHIEKVSVPPIKCQGIKTKLIPFLARSISWNGEGRWLEPFLGSGVVPLNLLPDRAILTDSNPHIIAFYKALQDRSVTSDRIREHLEENGAKLATLGEPYYYAVRDRFNDQPNPCDFLFLNRSCFNGVMRFNAAGKFNVPFCKRLNRFNKAHITRICNQVAHVETILAAHDWHFECLDWREALADARAGDFIYADPPYQGRDTKYFVGWGKSSDDSLTETLRASPAAFALSTWSQDKHSVNPLLEKNWSGYRVETYEHFYHVGPRVANRLAVTEALVLSDKV